MKPDDTTNLSPPLLPTKLFLPEAGSQVVARDRLQQVLASGSSARLVLVSAPAGSGKTTLVADWARDREEPTAWLSLDPSDDEPSVFLTYLVEALEVLAPGIGRRTRTLLELTPPPPPLTIATALVADLSHQGGRGVLVLDDYHVLSHSGIHEAVGLLIEHAPPALSFVLLTRSDPPFPLSRWRARGQLLEVRASELRFSPDEAVELLFLISDSEIGEDDVSALVTRTEGWAVGLHLAALALRQSADPAAFVEEFRGTHAYVADYLADEVLAGIPEEVQGFLVGSSLLNRITGPLCDAALERTGSGELLDTLARANLFLVPLDAERRWFRYHHLFTDLLRRRVPDRFAAESGNGIDPSRILSRAAEWCEARGYLDEAIEYSVRAGDVETAAGLVARHGVITLSRGEVSGVLRWLRLLPDALVRSSPDHCILGAWAHSLLEEPRMMESFASAAWDAWESGARPFPHVNDVEFHAAVTRAEARAVLAARPELALADLETVLPRIPERSAALRTAACIVRGELLALCGRHREALERHDEARRIAGQTGLALLEITSATGRAENLLALGRVREVRSLVEEVTSGWGEVGGVVGSRLGNLWALSAVAALELDELDTLRIAVSRAWAGLGGSADPEEGWWLAGRTGRDSYPGMHSTGRGVLHAHLAQFGAWLRTGDFSRVRSRLDEVYGRTPEPAPVTHALLESVEVRYRDALDDRRWLARWQPMGGGPSDSRFWSDVVRLTQARAALALGDSASGAAALEALTTELRERGAEFLLAPALLLEAEALERAHRRKEARALVAEALLRTAPEGRVGPWLDARRAVLPLLEEVLGDGKLPGSALGHATRVLVRLAERDTSREPDGGRGETVPLTDRELAVVRLLAAGRTNQEIASALFLAEGTVKKHTHNLYGKLGVRNRTEAVVAAREIGLLEE
jgi:LuxR family transcriptional regulator, maltose regulon positive regulatory protein